MISFHSVKWYHITSRVSFLFTALSHWYPHIICNKLIYPINIVFGCSLHKTGVITVPTGLLISDSLYIIHYAIIQLKALDTVFMILSHHVPDVDICWICLCQLLSEILSIKYSGRLFRCSNSSFSNFKVQVCSFVELMRNRLQKSITIPTNIIWH